MCRVSTERLADMAASQGVEGPPKLNNGLNTGEIVDLSSDQAVKKWLIPEYVSEDLVQDRLRSFRRSTACKEVAVAWRGCLPREMFEVLDVDTGLPMYFLGERRLLVTCTVQ